MNIGLFGHSLANWASKEPWFYISRLQDHFNANIVNTGTAMCSEERVLFQLKKTKKIDLAIIFHCDPMCCFIPSWHRDASTLGRDELERKFNLIKGAKIDDLAKHPDLINYLEKWAALTNMPTDEEHLLVLLNRLQSTNNGPVVSVLLEIARQQNIELDLDKIVEGNKDESLTFLIALLKPYIDNDLFFKELIDALLLNKKYLSHPDLQFNRYYGALMQIDQYVAYKQIPTVHCLGSDSWYPKWFKFTTGVCDKELQKFYSNKDAKKAINTPDGNILIFDKLLTLIDVARSKEVIH